MYIALDLETTGFEADKDQIIEIAAIKFDGDKILDSFETLINPEIPIPSIITHITGIKAENLTDSPKFAEIQSKLMEFLGNYPIVGHNINFDITFLRQKGLPIQNPLYDTLQLASILLPDLPSYSLDTLTRLLKITHKNKHRAMSDTEACYKLFLVLEKKIAEIDPEVYEEIKSILAKSTWELKELFLEKYVHIPATDLKNSNFSLEGGWEREKELESEKSLPPDLDENSIAAFYRPQGPFSQTIDGYEQRESQQRMSEKVWEVFKKNAHLLIEAGTGTGKTTAYLVSSIFWALQQKEKVVISTYTHNLQKQILEKDIPLFQKALPDLDFNVTLLKGRKNYLSLQRLEHFKKKDYFLDHEVIFLIKIFLWLKRTVYGDLEELNLQGKEFTLLDEVCCSEQICDHGEQKSTDSCYLLRARQKARNADIIIVNHALLLQHQNSPAPLLPDYHYLIIDEAHHLEKVATDNFTITLSLNPFERPFIRLVKVLENFERSLFSQFPDQSKKITESKIQNERLISKIEIFFGLIGIFLERHLHAGSFQYQLLLKENDFQTAEWQRIKDSGYAIMEIASALIERLLSLSQIFILSPEEKVFAPTNPNSSEKSLSQNAQELEGIIHDCQKRLEDLRTILSMQDPMPPNSFDAATLEDQNLNSNTIDQPTEKPKQSWVTWIIKSYEESISLKSAPLSVGENIQNLLFQNKKSIVLTSATLKTDETFNYIRAQLKLDKNVQEVTLLSHFDYPDQVKILIPEDLTEPATEGYFQGCADLISEIIKKNHGRTLALFTSKKALSATYHQIAPRLKEEGFTVLGQQITGGRGKILEHFKDEPQNCAILGLNSFWEGVDIKGADLTCVIIQKLPFDPPDDPLIQARAQQFKDGFEEYMLPRAILRFKQGFGRLIRTNKDTGSIVILDSRILQKAYGHKFLEALPGGIKIGYATKEKLIDLV